MKTAALILPSESPASSPSSEPLRKIGSLSAAQRLIKTFRQAGVDLIVLVSGDHTNKLEKQVARMGVICLHNEQSSPPRMLESAKEGLGYLYGKCAQVLITPVNNPLFRADTVSKLMHSGAKLANPICMGKRGYPLLIADDLIPAILDYQGEKGLRGAIQEIGNKQETVEVEDEGILLDLDSGTEYQNLLQKNCRQDLYPEVKLRLVKEVPFFGPGTASLLSLIESTESVRLACQQMGMSYSKAWKIIRIMEEQLGYKIVERRQGGANGGKAYLTEQGQELLERYSCYERDCRAAIQEIFNIYFASSR